MTYITSAEIRTMSHEEFDALVEARHRKFDRRRDDKKDAYEHNMAMIDKQDSIDDLVKFIELIDIDIMDMLGIKEQAEARIRILRDGRA